VTPRVLIGLWVVMALLVWNVVFDLYVSRGAREYLQLVAEADLGLGDRPAMRDVMDGSRARGGTAATRWALIIFGAGCATVVLARRRV